MLEETVIAPRVKLSFHALRATAVACLVLLIAQAAQAQIMVIVPHPDDEALIASGIIHQAYLDGKNVKVVIATNGDCEDPTIGVTRQQETVAAMGVLGLTRNDVIFLGYPDCGLSPLYYNYRSVLSQYTSMAGFDHTYASEGIGGHDLHTLVYGVPAPYNGYWLTEDLKAVLRNYKPQDVYVTSAYDDHSDHFVLNFFVTEALLSLVRADPTFQPTLHDGIVHEPCEGCNPAYHWPMPTFQPATPFPMPPYLAAMTPLGWGDVERIAVPAALQAPTTGANLKYQAIARYATQNGDGQWIQSFVKSDEIFWKWELWSNLALKAAVTTSSANGPADRLNDASVVGAPRAALDEIGVGEWVSAGEQAGAWATLTWPATRAVTNVVLHDRPDSTQNILGGRLDFSDSTFIMVPALPVNGVGLAMTFAQKDVTWVRFTVITAQGTATGLAEMEVYGPAVPKIVWTEPPFNIPPAIITGPTATPSSIDDLSTTTLSVTGMDTDGDPLSYTWVAGAGRIQGTGASVVFVPPTVIVPTSFAIDVYVSDGRGGIAAGVVNVMVTRSTLPHNVAPQSTATASSFSVDQTPDKAIDGIVGGYPVETQREWVTAGEQAGAWIQLTWDTPQVIGRSVLHDRVNPSDRILSGTMTFSDGSSIAVGPLWNDGAAVSQEFAAAKTVTWVRFTVTAATGDATGLAEWEIFGAPPVGGFLPDLAVDFGPSYGIWLNTNPAGPTPEWSQLHRQSSTLMATADLDGSDQTDLIIDFPGFGLWIWSNNSSWSQLHRLDVTELVVGDLDGNGRPDLVMSFPGYGVWAWMNSSTWVQRHTQDAVAIAIGNLDNDGGHRDELIVTFAGFGVWVYTNDTTWVRLHQMDAPRLRAGDMDGNGMVDLAADFPGFGLWMWMNNGTWIQRNTLNTNGMTFANVDGDAGRRAELVAGFEGYGTWVLSGDGSFTQLHATTFTAVTASDLDVNGQDDLVVAIPGAGVQIWMNNTNWIQFHQFDAEGIAAERVDGL